MCQEEPVHWVVVPVEIEIQTIAIFNDEVAEVGGGNRVSFINHNSSKLAHLGDQTTREHDFLALIQP